MLWCVWVIVAPPLVGKMAAGFFTLVRTGSNLTAIVFIVVNIILWASHLLHGPMPDWLDCRFERP